MRFCANIRDTYWNKILMKVIDSKILGSWNFLTETSPIWL